MDSYDVRFWDTKKIADNASGGRYRVRWAVNGQEHCKSFKNKTLADGFLDDLKDAARDRRPFSPRTGLPAAETTGGGDGHLVRARPRLRRGQVAEPRPGLPPVGRRGPGHRHGRPDRQGEGRARAQGAAPGAVRLGVQPRHPRAPTRRARSPSPWAGPPAPRCRVSALDDPATVRLALGACAKTLAGKPAAGSTQRRKRSVFYNALGYAVELGRLPSNPVDRIQWTAPAVAADRRPAGRGQPRPGQEPPGRRPGTV